MKNDIKNRDFAHGVAKSRIHWGADIENVIELLRADYAIEGDEADAIIANALSSRRSAIRKKALIGSMIAAVGLGICVSYFAIQGFVGFLVIGFGPIFMILLGLLSLSFAGKSVYRLVTGKAIGPV